MKYDVEYIIVGQGIAGSTLAQYMINQGCSVMVFGSPDHKRTSEVAAGLFNPITGKKMVLTWNAEILFPLLHEFYKNSEKIFNLNFFHSKPIYRPFSDVQSQNDFWGKSDKSIDSFAIADADHTYYEPYIYNEYGGIITRHSGYLDVNMYLNAVKTLLSNQNRYLEEVFDYEQLIIEKEGIRYKGLTAGKVIFAEGYHNKFNPYFNWLPVQGMKGDVLTVEIEHYPLKEVVNKHYFVIPLQNRKFKIGSSYIRNFEDDQPTEMGLKEITEGASKILKKPFRVLEQQAGIRPVVSDHRPIVGTHPEYPSLLVLNGLGTKGVSLAPFASKVLTDFLKRGQEIEQSISANRFYYLYFKQKRILI
jgi:glycine/D-amino acid oxidase-like deaminating enzyme